jgi:hypothetical protein
MRWIPQDHNLEDGHVIAASADKYDRLHAAW